MHGGVKFYRGSAAAARTYVEADRSRADDYYLAEGSGLAQRYIGVADRSTCSITVADGGTLDGDAYERWVAGYTADGSAKGRLRKDDQALRFVEVVVNGPKTWSLAASVDPAVAVAYDAAQERAATEIIGWLAEHSTTRVGPRGKQVQVPVEQIEAAVVRHYTSRAGDPHRHLHLQINARVWAAGKWRGLHTVGTVDQIEAINGIGHAAVMCDPEFRAVLTAHGYHLDPKTGEITELAPFAPKFSARAAQIARNTERFEAEWRTDHPDEEPGPGLRQGWDRRAWASARPDKVIPTNGSELAQRWREELADLGFTPPTPSAGRAELGRPVWIRKDPQRPLQVGEVDRDAVAETVIAVLGRAHSAWNSADIRGEVERRLAVLNLVAEPAARRELAEDLTQRALDKCLLLLPERGDVPDHVRSLSSDHVLSAEAELCRRLKKRAEGPGWVEQLEIPHTDVLRQLDDDQLPVVSALIGSAPIVIVEGAAGAGKTLALRATQVSNYKRGHSSRMMLVAPTMKAAQVAQEATGTEASSAAKLIHAHGYRWDDTDGRWWRDDIDRYRVPKEYRLGINDLLVVDEAGMLDQDTALALLTIADEAGCRVAFMGDRHQLPAVGRGGVLDHAISIAPPNYRVSLDTVRRFADPTYADLTLRLRESRDLDRLFDELLAGGHIQIHPSEAERTAALVNASLDGGRVISDSLEHVAALNAHIRDTHQANLQADGSQIPAVPHPYLRDVLGPREFTTQAGETLGLGDHVATRRNAPRLGVANRDRWQIIALDPVEETVTVRAAPDGPTAAQRGTRVLPASYAAKHLELAYATTVHGAQGETVDHAHYALDQTSRAAAIYVAMTRGRLDNTAHLIADSAEDARAQWKTAMSRGGADLGPAHARNLALEDINKNGPMAQRQTHLEAQWRAVIDDMQRASQNTPTSSSRRHSPSPSHGYGPSR
jgi:conjugative relaxase-like TrwC/TraI family protein